MTRETFIGRCYSNKIQCCSPSHQSGTPKNRTVPPTGARPRVVPHRWDSGFSPAWTPQHTHTHTATLTERFGIQCGLVFIFWLLVLTMEWGCAGADHVAGQMILEHLMAARYRLHVNDTNVCHILLFLIRKKKRWSNLNDESPEITHSRSSTVAISGYENSLIHWLTIVAICWLDCRTNACSKPCGQTMALASGTWRCKLWQYSKGHQWSLVPKYKTSLVSIKSFNAMNWNGNINMHTCRYDDVCRQHSTHGPLWVHREPWKANVLGLVGLKV